MSVGSVHNLHLKHFPNGKYSYRRKAKIMNRVQEQGTCISEMMRRRMDTTTNIARYIQQTLGMIMST